MDIRNIVTKMDLGQPYSSLHEFDLNDIFEVEKILQGRQINFNKDIDLEEEFWELINLIGIEKVKRLVSIFYKEIIYFPKIKETCKEKLQQKIISDFNGYNYTKLAQKYGYTERYIRNVIKFKNKNDKPLCSQLNIFDYFKN